MAARSTGYADGDRVVDEQDVSVTSPHDPYGSPSGAGGQPPPVPLGKQQSSPDADPRPYGSSPYPGPQDGGPQDSGSQYGGPQYGGAQDGGAQYGAPAYPAQPGGYGQPGPHGGAPARRNGLGTAALVLGILAVLTCWTVIGGIVLGLAAVVLGVLGRGRAKRREADNGGMALAGIITGVIGIVLAALLIVAGVSLLNSPEGQQLQDCLDRAGSNQAAVDQCRIELENSVNN